MADKIKSIPINTAIVAIFGDIWRDLKKEGKTPKDEPESLKVKYVAEFLAKNGYLWMVFDGLKLQHIRTIFNFLYQSAKNGKVDIKDELEDAINKCYQMCTREVHSFADAVIYESIMKENNIEIKPETKEIKHEK